METTTYTSYSLEEGDVILEIQNEADRINVMVHITEEGNIVSSAYFKVKNPSDLTVIAKFFEQVAEVLS